MKIEKNKAGYIIKWKVIKPCPFCSGKAIIDEFEEAMPYEPDYYYQGEKLMCQGCGVSLRVYIDDYATEDTPSYDVQYNWSIREKMRRDLLKKWNKRTSIQSITN
jgi:hypothetical protein